ncbi:hypothetical protein [uncultured Bacteroides sp.]|uniref:hypothetical protein n=1 Tax=uncultured Bacteroides sp. TaxID=162156 RepID=UPI002595AA4C|nr:hypothetical protein [uncultured Bacteroides sp.]
MLERIWADRNNIQSALSLYPLAPYPNRTCSVHSSVRSTSVRRNYGLGTEQVRLGYGINRTECLAAYSYRAQHR